ncbi:hypothetical protein GCM10009712_11770 [Pseudarthrobacter sulfonivorans]
MENPGPDVSAVLPVPVGQGLCKTSGMSDPRSRILPLLRQGEQLLWEGQPDPRVRFTGADASTAAVRRPTLYQLTRVFDQRSLTFLKRVREGLELMGIK